MQVQIQPIHLFGFGNADTLRIRLVHDNLTDGANFHFTLGRVITPEVTEDDPNPTSYFDESTVAGNVIVDGTAYAGWNGSNVAVPALVVPLIPGGVTLAG